MVYFNCSVETGLYGKRIRIKPIEGQEAPTLFVRCSRKQREHLPIGSIFTIDVKFIQPTNKKPYLIARTPFSLFQLSLF